MTLADDALKVLTSGAEDLGAGFVRLSLTEAAKKVWRWITGKATSDDHKKVVEAVEAGSPVSAEELAQMVVQLADSRPYDLRAVLEDVRVDQSTNVGNASTGGSVSAGGDIIGGNKSS